MPTLEQERARASGRRAESRQYEQETAESIKAYLGTGERDKGDKETFRVRGGPTRSERMNRALKELRPAAFKVQQLLLVWRGAPAKGNLPFFTIHSLSKFCSLTRPTVRTAFTELIDKGWIRKLPYDKHHKNTLYKLVGIRMVPLQGESHKVRT